MFFVEILMYTNFFTRIYLKRGDNMANNTQIACKNVFKSSDEALLKKEFNQKLIELINQMEKGKGIVYKRDLQVISHKI